MAAGLAIDVHGLTKRFGQKVAVNAVDIAVPDGEVWGLPSPNGSGNDNDDPHALWASPSNT